MTATKQKWSSKLTPENTERFYAFLDGMPEADRPVYAFTGQRSGVWHQLGGGTAHMLVLFYKDRLVVSKRGMGSLKKEKARSDHPLSTIADVRVVNGPVFSSVQFRFADGTKTKIANVDHAAARPLERYMAQGLAAFDRTKLEPATATDFWWACVMTEVAPTDLGFT